MENTTPALEQEISSLRSWDRGMVNDLLQPVVYELRGILYTNSLIVSRDFDFPHDKLLSLIEGLSKKITSLGQNRERFFLEDFDGPNYRSYHITKDGLFLLPICSAHSDTSLSRMLSFMSAFSLTEAQLVSGHNDLGDKDRRALDMGNLRTFVFQRQAIRVLLAKAGGCLFCGSDVGAALGYSSPAKEVSVHVSPAQSVCLTLNTATGRRRMRFITRDGLEHFVQCSKASKAAEFKQWVEDFFFPAIEQEQRLL